MKVKMLLAVLLLAMAAANAQTPQEAKAKKEITELDKRESQIKKEKRAEKKALRRLQGNDVSALSKQQFQSDFGKTAQNAKWKRLDNFDEVTFMAQGKQISAFYDYDAHLVGTTAARKFSDLPAKAQAEINKKYGDYTRTAVVMFDDNEDNDTDMVLYGRQFDDKDSYFIELGKANKKIVLQVAMDGEVAYFTEMK